MTTEMTPQTRQKTSEQKRRFAQKSSSKQVHSIADQLRQQNISSQSKKRRNDEVIPPLSQRSEQSTTDASAIAPMDMDFVFEPEQDTLYQQETINPSNTDDNSTATANIDNLCKDLYETRVDIRIKVPPHTNPEEKTVQVLQEFLLKLQSFDPKVRIAPWQVRCQYNPISKPNDFIPRPSELEKYFPRIFFKEEGFTWYSGVRLIHSLPMPDLRQDMIRWLKKEGHGLFDRMLQVEDTVEIG